MISSVILGLSFSNKHEFATLFFGGAFTLPQGRKEAPNIILFCMQSAWYVKMEFEHTHTHISVKCNFVIDSQTNKQTHTHTLSCHGTL